MKLWCSRRAHLKLALIVASGFAFSTPILSSEPVAVRHTEGVVHGFLALRTLEGATIAQGDLIQVARGARVTARLTFHFKDGSLHDETAVFSQRGHFRLITDHLVQKGPSFPRPLNMAIDAGSRTVTVHYRADNTEKEAVEHLELPPDLSNGLFLTLLKNANPTAPPKSLSFVAATPKPRLIKILVTSEGQERFSTAGASRTATHYVLKLDIGGLSGLLAPLLGKQPPDAHVWILGGEAPAFVKSEQQLYFNGPVWRTELVAPMWREPAADK